MKPASSSREALAAAAREIMEEQGSGSVSIRAVAARCGVSVGCVYRYFADKTDLMQAAVGSVWQEVFAMPEGPVGGFADCVAWILRRARQGSEGDPQFLTRHAAAFAASDKPEGRQAMDQCFSHMRKGLLRVLRQDKNVQTGVFGGDMSDEAFVDFVFRGMISALMQGPAQESVLLTIIRRLLYGLPREQNEHSSHKGE